jgi:agmatinase
VQVAFGDALDLSLVRDCASAEPGGMRYEELRAVLFALAKRADVGRFDLVEVYPMLDVATGIRSYLAAHTTVEFLGRICARSRRKARMQR